MKPFSNSPCAIVASSVSENRRRMLLMILILLCVISSNSTLSAYSDGHVNSESIKSASTGINCPEKITIKYVGTQAEIDISFEDWKNEFSVSINCTPVVAYKVDAKKIDLTSLKAPDVCGGAITVIMEVTSSCLNQTCESTFEVRSETEIVMSFPIADFTCWNRKSAPTYAALPANDIASVLGAFSIYSPCIDLNLLSLTTKDLPIKIIGRVYHFKRKYIITSELGFSSVGYEIFDIFYDPDAPIMAGVPEDVILPCGSELPPWPDVTATDMGKGIEVTKKQTVKSESCGGRYYVRTWSAVDNCDNVSKKSQRISFEDNAAPWITVPKDTTIDCSAEIPLPTYEAGDQGCSSFRVEFEVEKILISSCEYDLKRTWKVIDGCEQSTVKTQIIHVKDLFDPELIHHKLRPNRFQHGDIIKNSNSPSLSQLTDYNLHDIQISPNPAKYYTNVLINVLRDSEAIISIFNLTGELIERKEMNLTLGIHKEHLDLSTLSAGSYLIQLMINEHLENITLVKNQ